MIIVSTLEQAAGYKDVVCRRLTSDGSWELYFSGDILPVASVISGEPPAVTLPASIESGVSDLSSAVASIGSAQAEIVLSGAITVTSNLVVPANIGIRAPKGSTISIASGVTLRINGPFSAGNYIVFSGAGTVDFNEGSRYHNIAWYEGNSINEKWDFLRRGLLNIWPYVAYIPHPAENDPAATYSNRDGRKMWYWKLTAPMYFDDPENRGEWVVEGHIQAQNSVHSMLYFSPSNKCEDVIFRSGILLDGKGLAQRAVYVNGGARIKFQGQLYTVGCADCVHVKANLPISRVHFNDIYAASFSSSAVTIEAGLLPVSGVKLSVDSEVATNENCYGVKLIGDLRFVEVERFDYATGSGGSDLFVGVYVESNKVQGSSKAGMKVGPISGKTIKTGFMTRAPSGGGRTYNMDVGPIFPGDDYHSGVVAADMQNLSSSTIKSGSYFYPVWIDYNTVRVSLIAPNHNGIIDHGSYNSVNGIIRVSLAAGEIPSSELTNFGDKIVDLNTSRSWIKISDTGNPATDFVQIS